MSLLDLPAEHKDGVPWHDAPRPKRWHLCWVQTRGFIGFEVIYRCACGAIRTGRQHFWWEKNSRRSDAPVGPSASTNDLDESFIKMRRALDAFIENTHVSDVGGDGKRT